jgi:hypothetical protein
MEAVTEDKHRTLALWISNGCFAALLVALVIGDLIQTSAQTSNMVVNKAVSLSSEAGVSATKEPAAVDPDGQPYVMEPGNVETATCYATIGSSIWLYFHFGTADAGWAPFSDFHYQNGFPEHLPSHC